MVLAPHTSGIGHGSRQPSHRRPRSTRLNRVAEHPCPSGMVYPQQGGVPERPKGADCKSAGSAFPGSNPGAATVRKGPSDQCFRLGGGSFHWGGDVRTGGHPTRPVSRFLPGAPWRRAQSLHPRAFPGFGPFDRLPPGRAPLPQERSPRGGWGAPRAGRGPRRGRGRGWRGCGLARRAHSAGLTGSAGSAPELGRNGTPAFRRPRGWRRTSREAAAASLPPPRSGLLPRTSPGLAEAALPRWWPPPRPRRRAGDPGGHASLMCGRRRRGCRSYQVIEPLRARGSKAGRAEGRRSRRTGGPCSGGEHLREATLGRKYGGTPPLARRARAAAGLRRHPIRNTSVRGESTGAP